MLSVLEGFDGLASYAEIANRSWRSVGAGLSYSSTGGRRGGGCIVDNTTGSTTLRGVEFTGDFERSYPPLQPAGPGRNFEIGMAIKIDIDTADISTGWSYELFCLRSASNVELLSVRLYYDAAYPGVFRVWWVRGTTPTAVLISSVSLPMVTVGAWHYITILGSRLGTTATSTYNYILLDGVQIGYASIANAEIGSSPIEGLILGGSFGRRVSANLPAGASVSFDDVLMCTDSTADTSGLKTTPLITTTLAASTYVGPCRVDIVVPTSDHETVDDYFTPRTGVDEYAMTDDAPHDGDTTYVSASTIGHIAQGGRNTGANAGLPHAPTEIFAVRAFGMARGVDSDSPIVVPGIIVGTTQEYNSNNVTLPADNTYAPFMSFNITNEVDDAGTAFTLADLQATAPLLKIVS